MYKIFYKMFRHLHLLPSAGIPNCLSHNIQFKPNSYATDLVNLTILLKLTAYAECKYTNYVTRAPTGPYSLCNLYHFAILLTEMYSYC